MATKHASRRSSKKKPRTATKKTRPAKAASKKKAAPRAKKASTGKPTRSKTAAKKAATAAKKAPTAAKKATNAARKAPSAASKAPKKKAAAEKQATAPSRVPAAAAKPAKRKRVTAEKLGELQREISISEFFTKNRHLLGFDNASRALLTSVKEAVDNALDACEDAGIAPELRIRLRQMANNRFYMSVEDNGPGIVKAQIPKIFGKLLYGSKFHRLRQSRGQQGIGISAAAMYGQLTTGKPCVVTSKTGNGRPAHHYHIVIDTTQNRPIITHDDKFEWAHKSHGTTVEIEMEAIYKGGKRSVDEFVQQVAVANPHARIEYLAPGKQPIVYPRLTEDMPRETKEIKPHPYGVELGILQRMSQATKSRTLSGFLQKEFSRVSGPVAEEICGHASVDPNLSVKELSQGLVEQVYQAISKTKIMSPPTNCLAPIGEPALLAGLKALLVQRHIAEEQALQAKARKRADPAAAAPSQGQQATEKAEHLITQSLEQVAEVTLEEEEAAGGDNGNGDASDDDSSEVTKAGIIDVYGKSCFITAVSRNPKVYRGNPFLVEAALAYGGELPGDDLATVVRLANRVPLLYQQGACAMSQAITRTNWRSYDVDQSRGALPSGPLLILVHIASVWVPFTSEAKEAVAHYDEIIGELKFALQECGRRLSRHIRRRRRVADAEKKQKYIERYIPHIGIALQDILGLPNTRRDKVVEELTGILERSRKM